MAWSFIGPAAMLFNAVAYFTFVQDGAVAAKQSKRKVVVLTGLVGMLTLTSALLLALAPPPLAAESYNSLAASDQSPYLDEIFKTSVATKPNQWKYIYVHHSQTATGSAATLAQPDVGLCDHFVIGNGDGCQDGEIQIGPRWNQQRPAAAPPGVDSIEPDCVSICLVGDFDKSMPTPMQIRRLAQLVSTLQGQYRIPADKVVLLNEEGTGASVGKYFPVTAFRDQIMR
jgi:hypothetical protein